jgi:hypothetical protein
VGSLARYAIACTAAASIAALIAIPSSAATWSITPTPGGDLSWFNGVTATSASNAWAVGTAYDFSIAAQRTLIARWNGTSWSRVSSPNGSQFYNELYAVDAASSTNAWAVGSIETAHGINGGGDGPKKPAAWQWNGTAWKIVNLPSTPNAAAVSSIDMLSATDAWTVGWYYESLSPTAAAAPYMAHWNGATWTKVDAPAPGNYQNSANAVAGTSPADVWAVGSWRDSGKGQVYHPLMLHWNGTAWSQVAIPDPVGGVGGMLSGVTAISPTDAWAVGLKDYKTPVSFHWNGTTWSEVPIPPLGGTTNNFTYSVSGSATGGVYAVGYTSASANNPEVLIERWTGTAWQREQITTPWGGLLRGITVNNGLWAVGYQNGFTNEGALTNRTLAIHGAG